MGKEERHRHYDWCHMSCVRENYVKVVIISHKLLAELIPDFQNYLII